VREENALPTNFGEIARYNKRIAARFYLQAKIERDSGKYCEADYHAQLAVRYLQAAQEQWIAMCQEPSHSIKAPKPRPWTLKPQRTPLLTTGRLALQRITGQFVTAVRQSISRRDDSLQGLSLN
jgi:hypothetical protein